MRVMLKQVQKLIILLLIWVSLPIFLLSTNPERLNLIFLIVPYILLFVTLFSIAHMLLRIFAKEISKVKRRTMSAIFGFLPTLLLLLSSIGQLTVRDTALVLGLLTVVLLYLKRLDFITTK